MVQNDGVPTQADWGDYKSDIDTEFAYKRFAGKTRHEILPYFEAPLMVSEDIDSMPDVPFRYYVFVFEDYLRSKTAQGDSDAASTFLHLLIGKLKRMPEQIAPVMVALMPLAEYVAANQEYFAADIDIYGSFPELLKEIKLSSKNVVGDDKYDFDLPVKSLFELTDNSFEFDAFKTACTKLFEMDEENSYSDLLRFKLHPKCLLLVSVCREEGFSAAVSKAVISFRWWKRPLEKQERRDFDRCYENELNRAISILGKPAKSGVEEGKEIFKFAFWRGNNGILILQQSDRDPQLGYDINYWVQNCDPNISMPPKTSLIDWLQQVNSIPPRFILPADWQMCGPGFENELAREVSVNFLHPLKKVKTCSVARRIGTDDILFKTIGHQYPLVEVHLTWSLELRPEWPDFTFFSSWTQWSDSQKE